MTPYEGDPLKMLADAAKRHDMRLGFYYSIMDWHHPDYLPKREWEPAANPNARPSLDRYIDDFAKKQIRELLSGYGDVAVMWFDGQWEHSSAEMHSDEIYEMIRSLQPNTLINDRLFHGPSQHHGDYGTPEQFVPATGVTDAAGRPMLWEECATINTDSWGYNKYETEFKTTRDLIRMLIEVVSKGGNLLLNVGPTPDGRIQDEFVTRLNAMGDWMRENGAAIYGTKASPFPRLPFFGRAMAGGRETAGSRPAQSRSLGETAGGPGFRACGAPRAERDRHFAAERPAQRGGERGGADARRRARSAAVEPAAG
jgi:alpha-L-fucosidase